MEFLDILAHFSSHKTLQGLAHFDDDFKIIDTNLPYARVKLEQWSEGFIDRLEESRRDRSGKDRFILPFGESTLFFAAHENSAFLFLISDQTEMRPIVDNLRKLVISPVSFTKPLFEEGSRTPQTDKTITLTAPPRKKLNVVSARVLVTAPALNVSRSSSTEKRLLVN